MRIDVEAFHRGELPARLAAGNGALAAPVAAGRRPMTFVIDGTEWTYEPAPEGLRIVEGAVETLQAGEAATLRAAAGKADITDVVTAVSQAEITLQTVVAVRDRVIQAYQDILRMPI